ncbi:MAG: hypothetical protein AB7V32_08760, partial [Candidatus Berkiella sp.]
HYQQNPFRKIGEELAKNKTNPRECYQQIYFMVEGARRECVQAQGEDKKQIYAKFLALEEILKVVSTMMKLDDNNCRYSDVEIARKMARIDALANRTNLSPQEKSYLSSQVEGVLKEHQHHYVTGIKRRFTTNERGKQGFDTSLNSTLESRSVSKKRYVFDQTFHESTASNYNLIKISHSDGGKVVHLGFSFDREKVLKGNKMHLNMMKRQVRDALAITLTEFNKGSESNPIVISYRPPTIKQPETALAMLESLKATAIIQGRSLYIVDPNDPSQKVEFTCKATLSPKEVACFSKFANEHPTTTSKNRNTEPAGKAYFGIEPGTDGKLDSKALETKLKDMCADHLTRKSKNLNDIGEKAVKEAPKEKSGKKSRLS